MPDTDAPRKFWLRRVWEWFWRPSGTIALGVILIVGGFGGIVFWGGLHTAMEATNNLEFCISCHEMRDTVYLEYRESVHFRNASGVRAVCTDCHVPREWGPMILRKISATAELYHHFAGSIPSPEHFEERRLELAERVWAGMRATDSRECRNCHSFEAMDFEEQRRRSAEKHPEAIEEGETCIDCHQGIVHRLPRELADED